MSITRRRSSLFSDIDKKNELKVQKTMRIIENLPEVNSDSDIVIPEYLKEFHRFDHIDCEKSFFTFSKTSSIRI